MMKKIIFPLSIIVLFALSFRLAQSPDSKRARTEEQGESEALAALTFWTNSRAYPFHDIPPDKYYRAFTASARIAKVPRRAMPLISSDTSWTSIGPLTSVRSDNRGRAISVAVNPLNSNTIYCGSASGGLWRSQTAGLGGDWQRIFLGYPALGISAIVVDPVDTNILYLGTGEVYAYQTALGGLNVRTTRGSYGIGILKSTDNGASWGKSLDWTYNQERGIQQIRINPLNRNTVFAATTEGIFRSMDAGAHWTQVHSVLMATDILVNGSDTTLVLAACGNFSSDGYGVYRSTDAGTNWSRIAASVSEYSGKTQLEAFGSNNNIVFASTADSTTGVGWLWKSTDFGATWGMLQSYGLNSSLFQVQGWYSHFVAVHPTDVNQIVHAGVPISKSTNGGNTFFWSYNYYSDNHGYAHDPNNPNILYDVCDNGIYRSTDFGTSFTDVGNGMLTLQFYNGFSCSATDPAVALGQVQDHIPGFLYRGTTSWWRPGNTDEVGWTGIDQKNDSLMYVLQRYGQNFYRSTNRGSSFSYVTTFSGGGFNSPIVVSPSNPAIVFAASDNAYKSTNTGVNFFNVSINLSPVATPALSMAISSVDPNIVFIGFVPHALVGVRIFRTSDGGTSWTNVASALPNRYPLDIAVNPKNSNTVYAAFGGFGTGHVFKSSDLGNNWLDVSGTLPDVPTGAVLVDPFDTSIVYVGNDIGVYVSSNGGGSWLDFSEGLPEAVIVADLSVNRSGRRLRVATHGSGVYDRALAVPNILDYQALSLQSPPSDTTVAFGSTLSPISATFRNIGAQLTADSFNVSYRILKGTTQFFSSALRLPALGLEETRQVTFEGSFTPPDTGVYILQAVSSATDAETGNDTLRGTLSVRPVGSIAYSLVSNRLCSYADISGGSLAAAGDDNQTVVALPFPFVFDNHQYDSVQMSTNGWIEFGTGTRGSPWGISAPAQLSGSQANGTLFSTSRPTKTLGVWWEDLSVDGAASLSYTTTGVAPNRTFVVQWKNVLAYHTGSTTRINFQAELCEGSNLIEYHYGPVLPGTFPSGPDVGAMRGMKDDAGGSFHFYDMVSGTTGLANQGITNLTPLANWPGPDSCFRVAVGQATPIVSIAARWNLISVPVGRSDYSVAAVYPTAIHGTTYGYDGGTYEPRDTLIQGKGYWTKFPAAINPTITGTHLSVFSMPVVRGWNLVGSIDHDVPAPGGGIIASDFYEYSGGYRRAAIIKPGKGYWVKTSANGSITLGPSQMPRTVAEGWENISSITIQDNAGCEQTLFLADNLDGATEPGRYEMPPVPPAGIFDARFASQRIVEPYPQNLERSAVYSVVVSAAEYPLQIHADVRNQRGARVFVEEVMADKIIASHALERGRAITIRSLNGNVFLLRVQQDKTLPRSFALRQNYPNPFNPVTTIAFDVPEHSRLSLKVYDITGRVVKVLAEGMFAPGSHVIDADFSGFASGIYFYRLEAATFSGLKKMVLIK